MIAHDMRPPDKAPNFDKPKTFVERKVDLADKAFSKEFYRAMLEKKVTIVDARHVAPGDTAYVDKAGFESSLQTQKKAIDAYEKIGGKFAGVTDCWNTLVALLEEPGVKSEAGDGSILVIDAKKLGALFAGKMGAKDVDVLPITGASAWACMKSAIKSSSADKPK